jgi:Mn2+/Fe2+ NRAMP family transporter
MSQTEEKKIQLGSKYTRLPPLTQRDLPDAPGFWSIAGPGWISAAGSIGSGEIFFWPTLVSFYGARIMWLHNVSAFAQFWLSRSARRYTVVTGESLGQGVERIVPFYTILRIFLAAIGAMSPGWAALAATTLMAAFGFPLPLGLNPKGWEGWCILNIVLILIIVVPARVVIRMLRTVTAGLCLVLIATAWIAAALAAPPAVWADYFTQMFVTTWGWLPTVNEASLAVGISWGTIAGAVAYAYAAPTIGYGASMRVRGLGHGMGKYMGRITGLRGKAETITQSGFIMNYEDPHQLAELKKWMRGEDLDNGIFGLMATMATSWAFCLGSYAVLYPRGLVPKSMDVAVTQAEILRVSFGQPGWYFMLFITWLTLWTTQMSGFDGGPRNAADMIMYMFPGLKKRISFRGVYWLWMCWVVGGGFAMILSGIALPGALITFNSLLSFIQAVPACLFAAYIGERLLPKQVRAPRYETVIILIYAVFYGIITAYWLPGRLGISVPWV